MPTRSTDDRRVVNGGRYGLIDASTSNMKNSQFVSAHVRGHWCAARNRHFMEFLADHARDGKKVGWFACDNMSRIPLVVDAWSHRARTVLAPRDPGQPLDISYLALPF